MELKNLKNFNPSICVSGKMMRLQRVTASIFRKHLNSFDITNSQLSLLFVLTKKDGMTQKQLSDFMMIEKSSLHRNLVRHFEKGHLSRQDFPIIRITEKGKVLVNEIIPEWEKAMLEIRELLGKDGENALNIITSKLLNKNK